MEENIRTFGAVLAALWDELDWELLGRSYCTGDGSTFFDERRRANVLDTGLRFADDLAARLKPGPAGKSLYVGAAAAELATVLAEHLVLARRVVWVNQDGEETRELARALRTVGARRGAVLPVPQPLALRSVEAESCDHLWLVSVLTDPEAFPALHDELYERTDSELATGRGDLAADRLRARDLARELLACGARECVLSSTDEEFGILREVAAELGRELHVPRDSRVTALVGDRVHYARLRTR